jgi:hypothetical protein
MTDYIIALTAADDDLFDENTPRPSPSALMAEYNDGVDKRAYLTTTDVGDWPGSAYIVGAWDSETGLQEGQTYDVDGTTVIGTPTHPVTADYTGFIRPLGNDAGRATGLLDSLRWAGHPEQKFLQDDQRYPDSDSPFTLQITRQDYGSDAQPWDSGTTYAEGDFATSGGMWRSLQDNNLNNTPFGGSPFWEFINQSGPWGWRVDMLSDDPGRDITARAIGVYSDPEATAFLFTTGAFVDDGQGNFFTECPAGNRDTDPDPVYFALLLGAAQEGIFQLDSPEEGAQSEALFWSADQ